MKHYFVSLLLILCILNSCQTDKVSNLTSEDRYFEDYQSPEDKWGYIDQQGKIAISAKYDNARDFSNGIALVNYKGKWGAINHKGVIIVPYKFRQLSSFTEGTAVVKTFKDSVGVINLQGDILFQKKVDDIFNVASGLFRFKKNGSFGFLDKEGQVVIDAVYASASDFKEGIAVVNLGGYGVIDNKNNVVIPFTYEAIMGPIDGFLKVKNKDGWILFDSRGSIIRKGPFRNIEIINRSNVKLIRLDGNSTILNLSSGKETIVNYENIAYAGENRWLYYENGKTGILDDNLKIIVEAKYDLIYHFSEGLAGFSIDDLWGYVDINGVERTPPLFPLLWNFVNGHARVILPEGIGFINKEFQLVIPGKYREVRDFSEGFARVQVPN